MIPKIKKEIKKFLNAEEGSISKKAALFLGMIITAGAIANAEISGGSVTKIGDSDHCNLHDSGHDNGHSSMKDHGSMSVSAPTNNYKLISGDEILQTCAHGSAHGNWDVSHDNGHGNSDSYDSSYQSTYGTYHRNEISLTNDESNSEINVQHTHDLESITDADHASCHASDDGDHSCA